eukprot:Hpha_TRINITY_DN16514_c1_g3::TRINITY_DN16514_c1_g3_i1::g.133992::m.133992/K12236/NFX1; transcriptional repressor NF-X1
MERRLDPSDGQAYTYEEFRAEYGSDREWLAARSAHDYGQWNDGLPPPPRTHFQYPETGYRQQPHQHHQEHNQHHHHDQHHDPHRLHHHQQQSQQIPAQETAPERRIDPADGRAYTVQEFVAEYGGSANLPPREWMLARRPPANAVLQSDDGRVEHAGVVVQGSAPPPAAAAAEHFYDGYHPDHGDPYRHQGGGHGHGPGPGHHHDHEHGHEHSRSHGDGGGWGCAHRSDFEGGYDPYSTHEPSDFRRGGGGERSDPVRGGGGAGGQVRQEEDEAPRAVYAEAARKASEGRKGRGEVVPAKQREKGVGTELAEDIAERLESGAYECMVCTETVRRADQVWSCRTCYALFHLECVSEWAGSATTADGWRCPACQAQQKESAKRLRYRCFCGKEDDPEPGAFETPHSCGETCGRKREGTQCPHPCTLPCHPGPCPPCIHQSPEKSCHCGKMSYRTRCSDVDEGRSCERKCGRVLGCGVHRCRDPCHAGECAPCGLSYGQRCFCGSSKDDRATCKAEPGAEEPDDLSDTDEEAEPGSHEPPGFVPKTFSCGKLCGKPLGCGNHSCERECHHGPCGDCPLLPANVESCPCGKMPLWKLHLENTDLKPRSDCTDPIPDCGQLCGRPLACGVPSHRCERKCHTGPCGACTQLVLLRCRCQARHVKVLCADAAKGDGATVPVQKEAVAEEAGGEFDIFAGAKGKKGKKKPAAAAMGETSAPTETVSLPFRCLSKCGVKKHCTKHICNTQCCPVRGVQAPPGDAEHPHRCTEQCGKPLPCKRHRCELLCHRGACPPCPHGVFEEITCRCGNTIIEPPIPCGTAPPQCPFPCSVHRPCEHETNHKCHFGDCPPCIVPVRKKCSSHGNWCDWLTPCHIQEVSCAQPCGRVMPCGKHSCRKPCHSGECGKECNHPCGKRLSCGHQCPRRCHAGGCDVADCRITFKAKCECGRSSETLTCYENQRRLVAQRQKIAEALMKAGDDGFVSDRPATADGQIPLHILRQLPDRLIIPCGRRCCR